MTKKKNTKKSDPEKQADLEKRAEAFLRDLQDLYEEHQVVIRAEIEYRRQGIVPTIKLVNVEEEEETVDPEIAKEVNDESQETEE